MVDKWRILMNTILDTIHDADVEGCRGECRAIMASSLFADEWSPTSLCLDIEHVLDRVVVPRYIAFVVNTKGI